MEKVLIVTYYWPPAGGPGVQRWLKFAKYLPEFGFAPYIYTPENPSYPIIDEALVNEIPSAATVIKRPIMEPYGFASVFSKKKLRKISAGIIPSERKQSLAEKVALWIRGNVFIPDARVLWVRPSVSFLEKYLTENDIRTVITTGPPHSLHLIGLRLKKRLPIRWIADFRDPWTTIGYQKSLKLSGFSEQRHKSLEEQVLNFADDIIVTSKSTKEEFSELTSQRITVITNGHDIANDFETATDKKFTIAHIGSMLSERNPKILWQSLAELIKEVPGFGERFELKLIGTVSHEIKTDVLAYNLGGYTRFAGYVPHDQAVREQRQSQVLLLIEINSVETKSIIPGKLFEYMVSGRPIIAIGPNGSDFAEIIDETNTGIFVDYSEKDKLKSSILGYYESFVAGNLRANATGTEMYSRRNLTKKLANLLNGAWE